MRRIKRKKYREIESGEERLSLVIIQENKSSNINKGIVFIIPR